MANKATIIKDQPITHADRVARTPERSTDDGEIEMPRPGYAESPGPITRGVYSMIVGAMGVASILVGILAMTIEVGPAYLTEAEDLIAATLVCLGGLGFVVCALGISRRATGLTLAGAAVGLVCGLLSAVVA